MNGSTKVTTWCPIYHYFLPLFHTLLLLTSFLNQFWWKEIYCLSPGLDNFYFSSSKLIIKPAQRLMQFKTFMKWHNIISSPTVLQILHLAEVFTECFVQTYLSCFSRVPLPSSKQFKSTDISTGLASYCWHSVSWKPHIHSWK